MRAARNRTNRPEPGGKAGTRTCSGRGRKAPRSSGPRRSRGRPRWKYGTAEQRRDAILSVLKASGKEPRELTIFDFHRAGRRGLVEKYYDHDVSAALRAAGFDIKRSDMVRCAALRKWDKVENRARAVRECVERSGKMPGDLRWSDLIKGGLAQLIQYRGIYDLLVEAGYDLRPWEAGRVDDGFWRSRNNRSKALRWLIELTKKDPEDLRTKDFKGHGLFGLWQHIVRGLRAGTGGRAVEPGAALARLLEDAGLGDAARTHLRKVARRASRLKRDRRAQELQTERTMAKRAELAARKDLTPPKASAVVDEVLARTGKALEGLRTKDFCTARYAWALKAAGNLAGLLRLAGHDIRPWQLSHVSRNFWKDPKNRAGAIKWLIERSGKAPERLLYQDFKENGLLTLTRYDLPGMVRAAGLEMQRWQVHHKRGRWKAKDDRVAAVRWLLEVTGKEGQDICLEDFEKHGLQTLWDFYHPSSCKDVARGELLGHGQGWLLQYRNPSLRAAAEAGALDRRHDALARDKHPIRKYRTSDERIALVRKAVELSGKRPEEVSLRDLKRAGLTFLMLRYYRNDLVKVLQDAGYGVTKGSMRRSHMAGKWTRPEERVRAVRAFVETSGKRPEDLTARALCDAGLGALLQHKRFFYLLKEAGYEVVPWLMASVPKGFWKEPRNRALAVHWLMKRTKASPMEIGPKHYKHHYLFGLWQEVRRDLKGRMCGRTPRSQDVLAQLLDDAGFPDVAKEIRKTTGKYFAYRARDRDMPNGSARGKGPSGR